MGWRSQFSWENESFVSQAACAQHLLSGSVAHAQFVLEIGTEKRVIKYL